jgi:cellobiose phosphorylase
MIAGQDADRPGEAKNSWLTGTAAWNFVAITHWILGIRPDYEGLRIEPVLPEGWDGYRAIRRYRNVTHDIEVVREGTGNDVSLVVDGKNIEGTLIPQMNKAHVSVKAILR